MLEANAIRYFDGTRLARDVRGMTNAQERRFSTPANANMLKWAMAG